MPSSSTASSPYRDWDPEKGEAPRHLKHKYGTVMARFESPPAEASTKANGSPDDGAGSPRDQQRPSPNHSAAKPAHKEADGPKPGPSVSPAPDETAPQVSVFQSPPVKDPDPAAERLAENETPLSKEDFQYLMGVRESSNVQSAESPFKQAVKGGLFHAIHSTYEGVQYRYRIFNVATYLLLALQVIIGAIFIVLGALRNPRVYIAISILGAISTAVGGALALMKGQGLPNRLREARNRLRNVIFEAEELYWDFRSGRPIIYSDVKKLREDYLRVMEEMRRNHPDVWTDAANSAAKTRRMKK